MVDQAFALMTIETITVVLSFTSVFQKSPNLGACLGESSVGTSDASQSRAHARRRGEKCKSTMYILARTGAADVRSSEEENWYRGQHGETREKKRQVEANSKIAAEKFA